jgi:hypothetical protein
MTLHFFFWIQIPRFDPEFQNLDPKIDPNKKDSNIKDNYKKGNKTFFFNERSPKSIESTLFHGSGDYFVLAPINTNLAPN